MTDTAEEVQDQEQTAGAFQKSLVRSNKTIKNDRAEAITEDCEMALSRAIQDMRMAIKRKRRERDNMLDLSPANSFSLMVANDFDSAKFVESEVRLATEIRNDQIILELVEERYNFLFGGTV